MTSSSDPGVSTAEIVGEPRREISIEVPQANLRAYGLTLDDVSARVAGTSLELPGGSLKTSGGEILLRTTERRRTAAEEYESIPDPHRVPRGRRSPWATSPTVRQTVEDTGQVRDLQRGARGHAAGLPNWQGNAPRCRRRGRRAPVKRLDKSASARSLGLQMVGLVGDLLAARRTAAAQRGHRSSSSCC